jgi:hypothetical protein
MQPVRGCERIRFVCRLDADYLGFHRIVSLQWLSFRYVSVRGTLAEMPDDGVGDPTRADATRQPCWCTHLVQVRLQLGGLEAFRIAL